MSGFALVDGNNFYVSCERAFNPRLEGRPVVVLSNNDRRANEMDLAMPEITDTPPLVQSDITALRVYLDAQIPQKAANQNLLVATWNLLSTFVEVRASDTQPD